MGGRPGFIGGAVVFCVVVTGVMSEPCVGEFAIKEESNSS